MKRFFSKKERKNTVPVLCYHSLNIAGTTYETNDHIALERDLAELKKMGYQPVSVEKLSQCIVQKKLPKKVFCLTFDDASTLDYYDYEHPHHGFAKSFQRIIEESGLFYSADHSATAFAIASEGARSVVDRICIEGTDNMHSRWWQEAINKEKINIANHGLDHLHPNLDKVMQKDNIKGDFSAIQDYRDADMQIRYAGEEIARITNNKAIPYFAYPYGHVSRYLKDNYFPNYQHEHNMRAAFSTSGELVDKDTNLWDIPRLVCGYHWRSPEELFNIIRQK